VDHDSDASTVCDGNVSCVVCVTATYAAAGLTRCTNCSACVDGVLSMLMSEIGERDCAVVRLGETTILILNSFQQNVDVLWEMLLVHFYKFSLVWCSVRDDIRFDRLDETQGPTLVPKAIT
jgi:hypothetical protein